MARSKILPPARSNSDNYRSKRLERNSSRRHISESPPPPPPPPPVHSNPNPRHSRLPHNPFHRTHHHDHAPTPPPPPPPSKSTTFNSPPSTRTTRPHYGAPMRQNSVQTRYMNMLLAQDTIPRFHTILASFSTWILLAGFIIFPGTFTSLNKLSDKSAAINDSELATEILRSVKNIHLLIIAGVCSGIGALGMIFLWWRWRQNYVWLLNKIFLPGCLNSFAGLISTLVSVYSQQNGTWSVTAWVTAAVTGGSMVITGLLFGLYDFWILQRVKRRHEVDMRGVDGERDGEGLVEKVERKMNEPALEPGSVV